MSQNIAGTIELNDEIRAQAAQKQAIRDHFIAHGYSEAETTQDKVFQITKSSSVGYTVLFGGLENSLAQEALIMFQREPARMQVELSAKMVSAPWCQTPPKLL